MAIASLTVSESLSFTPLLNASRKNSPTVCPLGCSEEGMALRTVKPFEVRQAPAKSVGSVPSEHVIECAVKPRPSGLGI